MLQGSRSSPVLLLSLAQQTTDQRLPRSPSFHPIFGIRSPAYAAACPGPACAHTSKQAATVRVCRDLEYHFIHAHIGRLWKPETHFSPWLAFNPALNPIFQPESSHQLLRPGYQVPKEAWSHTVFSVRKD